MAAHSRLLSREQERPACALLTGSPTGVRSGDHLLSGQCPRTRAYRGSEGGERGRRTRPEEPQRSVEVDGPTDVCRSASGSV